MFQTIDLGYGLISSIKKETYIFWIGTTIIDYYFMQRSIFSLVHNLMIFIMLLFIWSICVFKHTQEHCRGNAFILG